MAVVINKPQRSVNAVLREFAVDLVTSLHENFVTQRVFPTEVYPGYAQINALRARQGRWHSTGLGVESFSAKAHSAAGREAITLTFNDYLRFVDMGVGQGTRYDDVHAERKARHGRRYISAWARRQGESHRPTIMMEVRHLEARMIRFFADFYGREIETAVLKSFDDITPATMFM